MVKPSVQMRLERTLLAVVASSCAAAACDAPGKSPYFGNVSRLSVLDTTPQNGDTDVGTGVSIEIELGDDPASQQAVEDAFTLEEAATGVPVPVSVTLLDEEDIVQIALTGGLDLATTYRAALNGLVDARGRAMEPYEWTFTTIDPPSPALIGAHPLPGSTAPGNFVVRAVFSVPLNAALLGANPIRVNAGGVGGSTTYDASSNTLTFHPNTTANGGMAVALDPVTDVYGRQFAPSGWTFDANDAVIDATRPTTPANVVATETSAGTITVTFDPVVDDQWGGSDIRYEAVFTRVNTIPADCDDPFVAASVRTAVYGSASSLSISGLEGGSWAVTLDAEDGSGRRSLGAMTAAVPLELAPVSFTAVIQPLLEERCALNGCHTGTNPPGYVDYTAAREEIVAHEGQTGLPLVTPYCLAESYLWHKLVPGYEIEGQRMPPEDVSTSYLTRRERDLFRRWIVEQGGE